MTGNKQLAIVSEVKSLTAINPKKAAKLLEDYASESGDTALTTVLQDVEVGDVVKILGTSDFSSPSIISWLLTPANILDVVKSTPLYWEEKILSDPLRLQMDIIDTIHYIFEIQDDEERRRLIVEMLLSDDSGSFFVSIPFIHMDNLDIHYRQLAETIKTYVLEIDPEFTHNINELNKQENDWEKVRSYYIDTLINLSQGDVYQLSDSEEMEFAKI